MLDTLTKRRIDTARDILVGKLPDPKSQVEQITIALIYKFMDDMDKQSEELGGKATFFTGEYEKYAWSRIFDPRVSGYELVGLYGEAIQKMNHNPNIPQLFRDIFKNAYLPYRDSETLKMFLKVIGEFEYDHSEKLGDAFEYLLSIMGSQGDAGQFRTPRHIIDFMVKVVDPCKNETILDPACGTAGFLISSFNHIQNKNKKDGRINLTADERTRLINNFFGYDISPDMVRLSLVNMYLHKFPAPKIYEYDTLTSEEKWDEVFDVILANPPFMSPKGGIRPHKRFSVQAKRSEVLFVDYIAEHLNPNGRAGIIVPEGIIFQSGNAYKKLRKMLIETSLYVVASLPAGVFNPYSGVKTSILFLNKNLAKKTDKILFVKVNHDGFGLGAQRRKIKENDLPLALDIIKKYKQSIIENKEIELNLNEAELAHVVKKEKIAESGDYNLSGDRYKEVIVYKGKWDFVELGEVCEIYNGYAFKSKEYARSGLRVIRITNVQKGKVIDDDPKFISANRTDEFKQWLLKNDDILISLTGNVGRVGLITQELLPAVLNQRVGKLLYKKEKIINRYIFWILNSDKFEIDSIKSSSGIAQKNLSTQWLKKYKIPLPPFEIQEQIVAELDSYQKIIDGAKQVVENYKPTFKIDPEWEIVEIENICKNIKNITNPKGLTGQINYIGLENIAKNNGELFGNIKSEISEIKSMKLKFQEKNVLYAKLRPNLNKVYYAEINGICSTDIMVLKFEEDKAIPKLYSSIIREQWFNKKVLNGIKGAQLPRIGWDHFKKIKVPLPPIKIQQQIVTQIEREQKIINANKELITIFESKIKDKIADVWGEKK